jgi:rod shape determining protein RodA
VSFDRRLLTNFEWPLIMMVLITAALGVVNLYSAAGPSSLTGAPIWLKQIYWLAVGLGVMTAIVLVNYKFFESTAFVLYGLALCLLILVLFIGRTVAGSQRWLTFGPMVIQPSEIAKMAIIIILARYFARREQPRGYSLIHLVLPFVYTVLMAGLILREPDLGTTVLVLLIAGSMILYARVRLFSLLFLVGSTLAAVPVVWTFLKDYQKKRILAFLDPSQDPLGSSYHLIQSKIAVGSGQVWGKGFMAGTQSQLRFIPEKHTDFAFSVFAEEWGFVGVCVLFALLFLIVILGLNVARRTRDRFGEFLVVGVVAYFFWQVVINIGMVTGLLPVVGIPLPLVSYGGSSLVTTMIGIGFILNVSMRKFVYAGR